MTGQVSYEVQNKQNYIAAEKNLYSGKISVKDNRWQFAILIYKTVVQGDAEILAGVQSHDSASMILV